MHAKQRTFDLKEIAKDDIVKHLEVESPIYIIENNSKYRLDVVYDECPESPRKWDNICKILSQRGNWNIGDESYDADTANAKLKKLLANPNVYVKPIYMYDHSGQTISLTPFVDPWDSGICGFIYVDRATIENKTANTITDGNWIDIANQIMQDEIDIYDDFIRGAVYGFRLYRIDNVLHYNKTTEEEWESEELEEVDSCFGYYGYNIQKNGLLADALAPFNKTNAKYYIA